MKKTITTLATTGIILCTAAAQADVTAYGRVLYNAISDDSAEDIYFGRHEFAESNFGLKGTVEVGSITFGAQVEVGLNEGVSTLLQNGSNSRNRIQEATIGGSFGKFSIGTGPSASWVASDVDQSGTWVSDPLGMSQRFGATRRGPAGQSQTPFIQTQSIFSERVRYDTPSFGGFTLHAQYGEDSSSELVAKYLGHGFRATAWLTDFGDGDEGQANDSQNDIDGNGSLGFFGAENGQGLLLAYKFGFGLNLNATMGMAEDFAGNDREFTNVKIGYTIGQHAFSISNGDYEIDNTPDHVRQTIAYAYSPAPAVKMWLQHTNGDTDGQDDFSATAVGMMVKF